MNGKILVAYASRTGSTAGVAEAIGESFIQKGTQADVQAMQEVENISAYSAVVAGSAIQNRAWLPEAMEFVQVNQRELSRVPFAIFALCMTLAMRDGERYRPQVSEWLSPVRRLVQPVSDAVFPGILDIQRIPSFSDRWKFRLSMALGVWSEGDHRDWDAIYQWADELHAPLLGKQDL